MKLLLSYMAGIANDSERPLMAWFMNRRQRSDYQQKRDYGLGEVLMLMSVFSFFVVVVSFCPAGFITVV
jgi:hypothetical protein